MNETASTESKYVEINQTKGIQKLYTERIIKRY